MWRSSWNLANFVKSCPDTSIWKWIMFLHCTLILMRDFCFHPFHFPSIALFPFPGLPPHRFLRLFDAFTRPTLTYSNRITAMQISTEKITRGFGMKITGIMEIVHIFTLCPIKEFVLSMGVARIFSGVGDTFRKFWKKSLKEIAKNALFLHIFQKYNKPCVKLLRVWTKNANCWEILRKFWNLLMKIL